MSCWRAGRPAATLAAGMLALACAPQPRAADAPSPADRGDHGDLTAPIALVDGIGSPHRPVETSSVEAQRFYDQGLAYLAAFDWVRAGRSFHRALEHDPALAAAHAELARVLLALEDPEAAAEHAAEAGRLAAAAPARSRARAWAALATLQTRAALAASSHRAYLEAIERYLERFPDDLQARILRGNADPRADAWGQAGRDGAVGWYRAVLERDGEHAAAHHFLAHAYENLERFDQALDHARRFAELAPAAPHAHHMVAHVAPRRDGWHEARERLEIADRLHRDAFEAGELAPHEDWHFGHNLRLLAVVSLELDDHAAAEAYLAETFALPYRGRRAGFYCLPWIEYLLLERHFDRALDAATACQRRDSPLARVLGSALRGEALLGLDRTAEARAALEDAQRELTRLLADPRPARSERTFQLAAQVAVTALTGKLALHEGRGEEGATSLLAVARAFGAVTTFDAWAGSAMRLEGLARDVESLGRADLARALRAKTPSV